ncbi:methyl-accepting chemotaxis protein II [Citrobacter amalonaticus]|nr:methyl-accepting chemotaxis protein II [Citrobacter amalonaticus]
MLLDELDAAPLNAESKKVISGIRDVREQYLASRFRILQELQNHNRQAAMQEMMTTTVNVQQAYKEKVQALIAIEDAQMLRAGAQVESDFTANRALLIALALIGIAAVV